MEILQRKCFFTGLFLLSVFAGCAGHAPPPKTVPESIRASAPRPSQEKPQEIDGTRYYPIPTSEGFIEEGKASYYGNRFEGKCTANGELVDLNGMTAAHKTLPLGTCIKVTNRANNRSVIVRINDRGPFVKGRIVDVSRKAAEKLGFIDAGVASVQIEAVQIAREQQLGRETYWTIEPAPTLRSGSFTLQVGAFRRWDNADRAKKKIASQHRDIRVRPFYYRGHYFYRVQLGSYDNLLDALAEMEQLRSQGFGDVIVVALEETYRAESK